MSFFKLVARRKTKGGDVAKGKSEEPFSWIAGFDPPDRDDPPPEIPEGEKPNCSMCEEPIDENNLVSCCGAYYHFWGGASLYGGYCYDIHVGDAHGDEEE